MTDDAGDPEVWLGRDIVRRMRRPGPPMGRLRPSGVGSVAASAQRFAATTGQPAPIRRLLAGPGEANVRRIGEPEIRPPRWWAPSPAPISSDGPEPGRRAPTAARLADVELPARTLPRAVHRVPDEQSYTTGSIVGGLVATVAKVRRLDEVSAAGPMLTQQDRARLVGPRSRPPVAPPQTTPAPRTADAPTTGPAASNGSSSALPSSGTSGAGGSSSGSSSGGSSSGGSSARVSGSGSWASVASPFSPLAFGFQRPAVVNRFSTARQASVATLSARPGPRSLGADDSGSARRFAQIAPRPPVDGHPSVALRRAWAPTTARRSRRIAPSQLPPELAAARIDSAAPVTAPTAVPGATPGLLAGSVSPTVPVPQIRRSLSMPSTPAVGFAPKVDAPGRKISPDATTTDAKPAAGAGAITERTPTTGVTPASTAPASSPAAAAPVPVAPGVTGRTAGMNPDFASIVADSGKKTDPSGRTDPSERTDPSGGNLAAPAGDRGARPALFRSLALPRVVGGVRGWSEGDDGGSGSRVPRIHRSLSAAADGSERPLNQSAGLSLVRELPTGTQVGQPISPATSIGNQPMAPTPQSVAAMDLPRDGSRQSSAVGAGSSLPAGSRQTPAAPTAAPAPVATSAPAAATPTRNGATSDATTTDRRVTTGSPSAGSPTGSVAPAQHRGAIQRGGVRRAFGAGGGVDRASARKLATGMTAPITLGHPVRRIRRRLGTAALSGGAQLRQALPIQRLSLSAPGAFASLPANRRDSSALARDASSSSPSKLGASTTELRSASGGAGGVAAGTSPAAGIDGLASAFSAVTPIRPSALPGTSPDPIRRSPVNFALAPPRMSIHPAAAAPPVPAVAAAASATAVAAPAGLARRSLVDSTAALFRTEAGASGAEALTAFLRRSPAATPATGDRMTEPSMSVRDRIAAIESTGRSASPGTFAGPSAAPSTSVIPSDRLGTGELDDLVDQVVERIEQRVIDELERRGRYLNPGAF